AVSPRHGPGPAGRRGFRYRSGRSHGLRTPGRGARARRRRRNRGAGPNRPARRGPRSRRVRRGDAGGWPAGFRSSCSVGPRRALLDRSFRSRTAYDTDGGTQRDVAMLRRYNRLLVVTFVVADFLSALVAFALAYVIRFNTGLVGLAQPAPPFDRYLLIAPFVAVLVVAAFQLQGLYRLRRGRTRVDDFFGVLVGSLLGTLLGVLGTLYIQTYHLSDEL